MGRFEAALGRIGANMVTAPRLWNVGSRNPNKCSLDGRECRAGHDRAMACGPSLAKERLTDGIPR